MGSWGNMKIGGKNIPKVEILEARKAQIREWRRLHKDKVKEYNRRQYLRRKSGAIVRKNLSHMDIAAKMERRREQILKWRHANKDKISTYNHNYYTKRLSTDHGIPNDPVAVDPFAS